LYYVLIHRHPARSGGNGVAFCAHVASVI